MRFNDFFSDIQVEERFFDYSGYSDLLFIFDPEAQHRASFLNLDTGRYSYEYSGAYITSYAGSFPDLAFAVAEIFKHEQIPFADSELANAPSLSKISESAKLVAAHLPIPKTYGGTKIALIRALTTRQIQLDFPVVLKLANGERGRDNFTIYHENEIYDLFQGKDDGSIWVIQALIPSDGFYRLNCYFGEPAYTIFRSLEERPAELDRHTAHMYKPAGGSNATLIEPSDTPEDLRQLARLATQAMGREFAGVDLIYHAQTHQAYVLEVNYYPQLVTVNSFKERRVRDFLEALRRI